MFQGTQEGISTEKSNELGAEGTAEANFLVAKGSGKISGKLGDSEGSTKSITRTVSSRVTALAGLRSKTCLPLVIDDFHYILRDLQGSLVRALKSPIFDGLAVVLIAIPHRRYDALKVEKEMTGRLHPIQIPLWEIDELAFIPRTGFPLLGCTISENAVASFAAEAIGSPHLMQDFCRGLCRRFGVKTEKNGQELTPSRDDLAGIYSEVAETIGRPIFEKLARGPRQRTDRIPRKLKSGSEVDIYGVISNTIS